MPVVSEIKLTPTIASRGEPAAQRSTQGILSFIVRLLKAYFIEFDNQIWIAFE